MDKHVGKNIVFSLSFFVIIIVIVIVTLPGAHVLFHHTYPQINKSKNINIGVVVATKASII